MALKPPRICGCGYRVAASTRCPCEARRDKARREAHDAGRGSAARRGYDRSWRQIRETVLRAEPWCRAHMGRGERIEAVEVDHIDGDSRNNSTGNLRPLCKACHSRRTAKDQAFGRKRSDA